VANEWCGRQATAARWQSSIGDILAGLLHEAEGFVCAELRPARTRSAKFLLDVAGHYARPDIFKLTVDQRANPLVESLEDGEDITQCF
jgi:nitrilase